MPTCQINQMRMGDNTNLLTLSESAINAIKEPELVWKIIALKEKVIMDSFVTKYPSTVSQLQSTNEKIRSDLAVVKNVNTKLEEPIISLEKNQAKSRQQSRCNDTELSCIPNDIS